MRVRVQFTDQWFRWSLLDLQLLQLQMLELEENRVKSGRAQQDRGVWPVVTDSPPSVWSDLPR